MVQSVHFQQEQAAWSLSKWLSPCLLHYHVSAVDIYAVDIYTVTTAL